jgi:hypothetical protein
VNCAVTILGDKSISKVHAHVLVQPLCRADLGDPSTSARVLVTDVSTFGTWIDGERVDKARLEGAEVVAGRACSSLKFGC